VTTAAEVHTPQGWRRLVSEEIPRVRETDTIRIRGLPARGPVRIGFSELTTDDAGEVSLRPATDEHLSGHVGLIEVTANGARVGAIDLVPHKMSEAAYHLLRSDLQRVWTDLIFADGGPTSVQVGPPPARELWKRIDRPILQILEQPNTIVAVGVEPRRLDRVKRLRELTPAVVRAGQRQRPALTRVLQRTTDTPENQLCTATLQLLRSHARRDPTAVDLVANIDNVLRHPTLPASPGPLRHITWGMRSDRRYRQVLAVYQLLNRPDLEATEGPGELRLGVPALSRLYEYWVFLQVLRAAGQLYGRPEAPAFDQLAVPVHGNRRRLGIARGTTVTFPGPIHVAFEPDINARGDGWMGIEYVPHPDVARQQLAATPDVAVLDLSAGRPSPSMTIIDAKYVGRSFVELEAARVHEKYSRMRLNGVPVVENVLIAHPHIGLAQQWAGYGHIDLVPGHSSGPLPLPPPLAESAPKKQHDAGGLLTQTGVKADLLYVVADQYWMRQSLAGRRIDLDSLRRVVAGDVRHARFELAMPRLDQLIPFGRAAQQSGWHVEWLDHVEREPQISALVALVSSHLPSRVIVISGDPDLLNRLPPDRVQTFADLQRVSDL
jgi:hypothetical protein